MRKSHLALPGLLLAALAAAAPASADPVRLDEAGLGGVAAGMSLSTNQLSSTSTGTTSTISDVSSLFQSMTGSSVNSNYATGVGSQGVEATGFAISTISGMVGGL